VIPGASSLGQLEHNISAADIAPLTQQERQALQQISRANRYDAQYR
jgi:aryl-alcohol dehydrogenase-like predicted oxidoreductase